LHVAATDQHPQIDLRLVFKISKTEAGALKAVWYSIDQSSESLPIATVNFQDGVLKFKITIVDRSYEGKMSEDGKSIAGTWMEGTTPISMPLERSTPDTAWAIPEPPKTMAANADPSLEVATIKPSDPSRQGKGFGFQGTHFRTLNTNLNDLIAFAYGLHSKQITGAPAWFGTDLYDVDGVPDVAQPETDGDHGAKAAGGPLPVEVPPRNAGAICLRNFCGQRRTEDDQDRVGTERSAGFLFQGAGRSDGKKHEHDRFCFVDAVGRDGQAGGGSDGTQGQIRFRLEVDSGRFSICAVQGIGQYDPANHHRS
jgi:hypothetical protein